MSLRKEGYLRISRTKTKPRIPTTAPSTIS